MEKHTKYSPFFRWTVPAVLMAIMLNDCMGKYGIRVMEIPRDGNSI